MPNIYKISKLDQDIIDSLNQQIQICENLSSDNAVFLTYRDEYKRLDDCLSSAIEMRNHAVDCAIPPKELGKAFVIGKGRFIVQLDTALEELIKRGMKMSDDFWNDFTR